ncbi:uncharacterized protein LOC105836157 [Monomorium pharaonis]|uniref:uncharacterized protein LOC105836157 n=1 Tax=Monomorium pharaonis TaxID=307658 RepID=UPI00063FC423|nr:uncharacterized protein LOC105836157 [Monomorium pharaonis]
MNGVIWNKMKKVFVPISSVPMFAVMQQEYRRQSRALETHNFQLQNLTLTAFEEPYFLEFYDNDMKVTGLCGELWTFLSEKLNFTLQPVRSNETSLGASARNQTIFPHGLLNVISRNETIAIPKVGMHSVRLIATDFTMPLWMNSQRLYIQNEVVHDKTWMANVFSWKIWCLILVMHLLLSVCSFWSQMVFARINNTRHSAISDHIFYNFGMICNQSYIPNVLNGRSRIIETSLGLFCSILYMSFGALLFICIARRIHIMPPFNNLNSLISDTTYDVVVLKGSTGDIALKVIPDQVFAQVRSAKRFVVASTIEEVFKLACMSGKKKYTIFYGEDEYKTIDQTKCYLTPVGESYLKMWIASGIVKNFKYKKTINLGILRLKEVGLWNALISRWLIERHQHTNDVTTTEAIGMDQVSLIIFMMCCGMLIAFIIFISEKIVHAYKCKL